jgi:glycosyltransferase involved in cell wall biosynthesis
MRILIVNQWFEPEPTFKGLPFAMALKAAGHDVEVITGYPNYPLGKIYPGYEMRGFRREVIRGVTVIRVPLFPSHGRSAMKRALNYLSFSVAATIASLFMARRPDVTYFYVPAVTAFAPALALRFIRSSKVVLDIQDLWPEALQETGMLADGVLLSAIGWWCSLVYRLSDAIVVLSEGYRRRLVARGVDPGKVRVIENWAPDEDLEPASAGASIRDAAGASSDELLLLYAGNMGPAQDLASLLPAMLDPGIQKARVRLVLMGGGSEKERIKQVLGRLGVNNVTVLDAVPKASAKAIIAQADAVLVHLRAAPILDDTVPSKVQSYLASGTPLVAGVGKEAEALVLESGGGVTFKQGSPESFADAVTRLFSMDEAKRREMRASALAFYQKRLSMARAVAETIDVLRAAVGGSDTTNVA